MAKTEHRCSSHDRIGYTVVYVIAGVLIADMLISAFLLVRGKVEPPQFLQTMAHDCIIALLGVLAKPTKEEPEQPEQPAGTDADPVKAQITNTAADAVPVERVDTP